MKLARTIAVVSVLLFLLIWAATADQAQLAAADIDAHLREVSESIFSQSDARNVRELQQESILTPVVQRQQQIERKARNFRYVLFATSLLVTTALLGLGLELRVRSRTLRKRAAMDRVLARMSTRFIGSRPQDVAGIVERGLGEIAECWGAVRAYFASAAPAASSTYTYEWPPAGVRASAEPGPLGRLEVASEGRTAHYRLGLDFLRSPVRREQETLQLRMACDAIANAIERDFLERERVRLETHLQQARRMETIGALASGVAHNFNNIIGAILGFAESAESRPTSDVRLAEDIREIQRAGARARDLIDELLTFGRHASHLRTPVRLDALVLESKKLLEAALPATVRIVIREPFTPVVIAGAPAQLQQVILNIANNAAQAMDLAGRIEISIRIAELTRVERLNIGELQPGRYGILSISDAGRGMDAALRERIFDPFFTTRAAGNGLGLATARAIVLEHGGSLGIRSTPGVGTCFEIWLPAEGTTQPASLTTTDTPARDLQGKGETILVLDPDRARLLMHEDILAALGYEPVGFTDASAAIAACTQKPDRFAAALLCHQPHDETYNDNATGVSVRLHAAAPRLPIILATSSVQDLNAPTLAGNNVVAIIGQPTILTELAENLARTLRP